MLTIEDVMEEKINELRQQKKWYGSKITSCQICNSIIEDKFIDGATKRGWAIMCPLCHKLYGFGLGTGKGQLYSKNYDKEWIKIKG